MGNNFTHVFLTEGEAGLPYDPVGHGGSRFPLVGPVLRFTLEQNPVFLDWTQTPTTALRPVCSPATLWGRKTIINRMIKPPPPFFLEYIEIFHCFLLFSSPKRQLKINLIYIAPFKNPVSKCVLTDNTWFAALIRSVIPKSSCREGPHSCLCLCHIVRPETPKYLRISGRLN